MDKRIIGYWEPDWPLMPEFLKRDRPILHGLMEALGAAEAKSPVTFELEDMTVYVEGRKWRWRSEQIR